MNAGVVAAAISCPNLDLAYRVIITVNDEAVFETAWHKLADCGRAKTFHWESTIAGFEGYGHFDFTRLVFPLV